MLVNGIAPSQVGIVFDLDNTLVASRIDFAGMRAAVVQALTEAGLQPSPEQSRWPVGRLAGLADASGVAPGLRSRVWGLIQTFEVAGMKNASLEAGAHDVVTALHALGHPLAVLTNNSRSSALAVLNQFELTPWFTAILCRDDVTQLKPAPDGVHAARLALGAPPQLIVVGDSWIDGAAAYKAEARFVAVGEFREGPESSPVWKHVKSLTELLTVDFLHANMAPGSPQ